MIANNVWFAPKLPAEKEVRNWYLKEREATRRFVVVALSQ